MLASDFDVLILDEPTNHLDNAMLSWLEDYLKNYRGTVFMVTHDRYFLDKVSNRILEISHGKMYSYDSNYSRFLELKAEREEMELASERKRQSILRMELEWRNAAAAQEAQNSAQDSNVSKYSKMARHRPQTLSWRWMLSRPAWERKRLNSITSAKPSAIKR